MNSGIILCLFLSFVFERSGIIVSVQSSELCPTYCVCDIWYKLQRASCIGRHLYSIHTGVPNSVQALDLSNNSISSLNNFDLANAGLTRLKYLNLSGNSISEIGLNAFDGLAELTILDLSRNHLYYILSDVFVDSRSLRIVKLSKNNFNTHVPKLRSSSLTELYLDSCQISHLPLDTFNELTNIGNLDLSNNLMIQIDSVALHMLHFLKKLSLDGNPWSCNNVMYNVQAYLIRKKITFNAVCGKTAGQKKFEKMILRPPVRLENYHHSTNTNNDVETSDSANTHSTPSNEKNVSMCENSMNNRNLEHSADMSPFWFLIIGFILGSASSIVISYIWLTGNFSCYRRCRRSERASNDSQRLSLLLDLWHFQDLTISNNTDLVSCPDTPPPPYREVMLRPGLYGSSSSNARNLNNNNAGCSGRYT